MIMITAETNSGVWTDLTSCIQNKLVYILMGFAICIICVFIYSHFMKKMINNIEDGVMRVSFFAAIACLILSLFFKETDKSINVLSFFCSFIFSWLLTKKNSKEEFKERQQEIAKTSYWHIGDVKKTTLVTKNRLLELKKKEDNISKSDIDGILDDIEIILQCIATNERDWQDMLSEDYIKRMRRNSDPEDENADEDADNEVTRPVLSINDLLKVVGVEQGKEV